MLDALRSGHIDALARGEIGNLDAAAESGGALVVTALDDRIEHGGFTLATEDAVLAACLDRKIDWLTDGRSATASGAKTRRSSCVALRHDDRIRSTHADS